MALAARQQIIGGGAPIDKSQRHADQQKSASPINWRWRRGRRRALPRTTMAQTFVIIGPALWNQLPPLTCSFFLTGEQSASFRSLKTALFSLGISHWKRF